MSQHHLLHQHPALQRLLAVPPHTLGRPLSPTNVWIGTRGTVTSLHSDPSDNLLCQVALHHKMPPCLSGWDVEMRGRAHPCPALSCGRVCLTLA